MNTTCKRYLKRWVLVITPVLVISWTAWVLAQEKPPTPKEPVTNLEMPKPVIFQELKGKAILPKEVKLGFGLDLADKVLPGNWDVKAKVTAVDTEKVTFTTDKGETGNLVFRVPEELRLSLATSIIKIIDEPVFIKRSTTIYGAALTYKLVVESSGNLVVASGRFLGDSPQKVKLWDGFALEQSREPGQMLSKSKYEITYSMPVILITDTRKMQLTLGEAHEITVQGKRYAVMIHQSSKVVPTKEYEGVAEGSGYTLEYVAVPK